MQSPPPVDVMRTVLAVTDPLVAAGPNADTQSPTARAADVTDWVVFTGVEFDVVIFRDSVFGFAGCFGLLPDLLLDPASGRKLPGEIEMPEMVRVDPLTAVTLPDAISRLANCLGKLFPADPLPGNFRGPAPGKLRGPPPDPPWTRKPPAGGPPEPEPERKLSAPLAGPQVPPLLGADTVMLRAAIVVFDVFDADPVAVMQSPTVTALTASVTFFEKVVVGVQLTVV